MLKIDIFKKLSTTLLKKKKKISNIHSVFKRAFFHSRCEVGFFKCQYGACIPEKLKCNLERNCHDWSDEDEKICGVSLPDGACRLPPAKPSTHYTVFQCPDCRPGNVVPELTRIDYFCDDKIEGNSLEGLPNIYCQNNQWVPYLPTCYAGVFNFNEFSSFTISL